MELSSNPSSNEEDRFLDAPDEFFYDCLLTHDNSDRPSSSHVISPTAANLRRRKSVPGQKLNYPDLDSGLSSSYTEFGKTFSVENSDELSGYSGKIEKDGDVTELANDGVDSIPEEGKDFGVLQSSGEHAESPRAKGTDVDATNSGWDRVDPFQVGNSFNDEKSGGSTVTTVSDDQFGDSAESAGSLAALQEPSSTDWSLLAFLVGLVIKAIGLQVNLMISLITFPPWLCYSCCIFVLDPFGTMKRSKRYVTSRVAEICNLMLESASPFLSHWLEDYKPMLKILFKFGWGLFWAIYVGIVLVSLLVLALVLSGFVIRRWAEEPLVVKERLNFDYTKNSPEAYVPMISCAGSGCDKICKENVEMGKTMASRIIPQNHKIQVTISLTLPESEYNRNLGMFQVRVEFLSADGQTLASSNRPCMLKFRSEPIRLVQILLKIAPLVTGYVSESQTLSLEFKGFVEKAIPTAACLKVVIEQRAEFRPGAGVPELYDASMLLQSELPLFKRIIWNWRKTLFIWMSMSLFIMELLFTLVCCTPLIIPRTRYRNRTPSTSNTSDLGGQAGGR